MKQQIVLEYEDHQDIKTKLDLQDKIDELLYKAERKTKRLNESEDKEEIKNLLTQVFIVSLEMLELDKVSVKNGWSSLTIRER